MRLGAILDGQTLSDAKLPQRYKVTAVLITRPNDKGEPQVFEATADYTFATGDTLLVVGRRENINRFEADHGVKR